MREWREQTSEIYAGRSTQRTICKNDQSLPTENARRKTQAAALPEPFVSRFQWRKILT